VVDVKDKVGKVLARGLVPMRPRTSAASPAARAPRSSTCWAFAAATRSSTATTSWSNDILERVMTIQTKPAEDAAAIVAALGQRAKTAAIVLRNAGTGAKNKALTEGAA
jgi:hypothetical protein